MNVLALLSLVGAVAQSAQVPGLERQQCSFAITSVPPAEVQVKAHEDVSRLLVLPMRQGDPVVVTSMDLSALKFQIDRPALYLAWSGAFTVEVMNISDRPISRVSINLRLGWDDEQGASRFGHLFTPLMPGERGVIEVPDLVFHAGPFLRDEDWKLSPVLMSADVDGCRYSPSRVAPPGV